MANIIGTNKSDFLVGSAGNDVIDGRRGSDWIEGGQGFDMLTGGEGRDTFVVRQGDDSVDWVTDFQFGDTDPQGGYDPDDRVLFDFNSYSDIAYLGGLYDGLEFYDFTGQTRFNITAVDANSDGITDTQIMATDVASGDTAGIILLGWTPEDLTGAAIAGG